MIALVKVEAFKQTALAGSFTVHLQARARGVVVVWGTGMSVCCVCMATLMTD